MVDTCCSGPVVLIHSLAHLELVSSVFDFGYLDFLVPSRSHGHLDSVLLPFGLARPGLCLLTSDGAVAGLPLSLRSVGCPGFALLAFDLAHSSSMSLIQGVTHLGFSFLPCGLGRFDFVSLLPAVECVDLGLLLLLQSFA